MGVLNELYQVASLGAEETFCGDEGIRVGLAYSAFLRDRASKRTRATPLSKEPGVFAEDLADVEKMWHTRSEDAVTAARRTLIASGPINLEPEGGRRQPLPTAELQCLWYGIRNCSQKSCKRSHTCPYCNGTDCQSKEGYIEYHLGKLKTPRTMVSANEVKASGERQTRRSRSPARMGGFRQPQRSRSRGRERRPYD